MKKVTLLLSITFYISCLVQAQSDSNPKPVGGRTAFYAELGGPGILFSANIDSRFKESSLGLGGRAGIGFVTADDSDYDPQTGNYNYRNRSVITVPVQLNYIFGKPTSVHTFEVGAGLTYLGKRLDIFNGSDNERTNLYGTFSFMYRRQPADGGFMWRIGFTPVVANGYIQPSGGVGVGYSF